jgi:hypothetical protein
MNMLDDIIGRLNALPEAEKSEAIKLAQNATKHMKWVPNSGPQTEAYFCEADELFLGGSGGGGKCLPLTEPVLTPFGWKQMRDIGVGSQVCSPDGSVSRVIAVHRPGVAQTYRLTWSDGATTVCDDNHIWFGVFSGNQIKRDLSHKLWTFSEIRKRLDCNKDSRFLIPLTKPVVFTRPRYARHGDALPVDPYCLGVLLGDGSLTNASVRYSTIDDEIDLAMSAFGTLRVDKGPNRRLVHCPDLLAGLRRLGVWGKGAAAKRVPAAYMWASEQVRWSVLQGLMDTDGTADSRGQCYFASCSKGLSEDVQALCRSLGFKATLTLKKTTHLDCHMLYIRGPERKKLFRLTRKRLRAAQPQQKWHSVRRLVSIEPNGECEVGCFQVDNPSGLFLTRDFVVTHNTDCLLGVALNEHKRSLILRRQNSEVSALADRMEEILGSRKGYAASPQSIWRLPGQIIQFGGVLRLDDRAKYQGVPRDFIGFDEVSNFLEEQYTFIIGWARTTIPNQRVRVIAAGNPPITPEGLWVNRRWGAWLDPSHPNPALPGELRWYTTIDGKDVEVDGSGPVEIDGVPFLDHKGRPIYPKSRTFIPADIEDNPDLHESGYASVLAGMQGAARASMFEGDFSAGIQADPYQIFPVEWIEAAQARWSEHGRSAPMTVLAADIAQGGVDSTVLAPRHGAWFDRLRVVPGKETPDGPTVAGLVMMTMRDGCEVVIDMGGGYGQSTYDHLRQQFNPTPYNGASSADAMRDKSGVLKFKNVRAAATWYLREALDPDHGAFIALPPDPELKAELCAIQRKRDTMHIQVESKEDIRARIGRSPDRADAVIMAHFAKGKTNGARVGIAGLPTRAITSGRNPRR